MITIEVAQPDINMRLICGLQDYVMRITRIFLFASPLLLFIPPLIPISDNPGWIIFGSFYSLIVRRFPWNLVMGGLCYSYAQSLGRDAAVWAGFSFFFPFATPLVLAFRSP